MKTPFSAYVKAFMNLSLYNEWDQINIVSTLCNEPIMRESVMGTVLELACKFRTENKLAQLDELHKSTGLHIRRSIYQQETTHVFQHGYKLIAQQLLADYFERSRRPHKLPKTLVGGFHNCKYQGMSLKAVLNIVYSILDEHNSVHLLLAELADSKGTCLTGYFTRIINAVLPFVSYSVESVDYNMEKIWWLFNKFLMENNITDQTDIFTAVGQYASNMPHIETDLMLAALERYTGISWGMADGRYFCG